MKKLFLLALCVGLLAGCSTVKQAANLKNCTYALKSVELTDVGLTSLDFTLTIAITNPNKTEPAKLKRFVGVLTANDDKIADVTLKDIEIQPQATYNAKAKLSIPTMTLSTKLIGLLAMGSGTIDYHLTGTMYFEGPMGVEIPLPVDMGRLGNHN
ncbi:MAG: hypothetical protein J6Y25_01465 [Elusimicrobiaceae bacterium]|nr:hypothetical protein [Elusimicrobiaceae bacterium]MBP5617316.1 hypothetical protein [Elusimicrobiaceae bacterium]